MQHTTSATTTDLDQWYVLRDFHQSHPNFSRTQLEWIHRKRSTNGFSNAFRKIGKLRYIHAGIFADCLRKQNE